LGVITSDFILEIDISTSERVFDFPQKRLILSLKL
jgi:hypothetical protein